MKSFMRGIAGHKGLLSILAVLVIAIVGLSAGIIINNMNSTITEDPKAPEITDPFAGITVELVRDRSELADGTELSDDENLFFDYMETLERVNTEAERLLLEGEENIQRIRDLYAGQVEKQLSLNQLSRAFTFISAEETLFYDYGYDQEALKTMMDADCSRFDIMSEATCYEEIVRISTKLGDVATAEKYKEIAINSTRGRGL